MLNEIEFDVNDLYNSIIEMLTSTKCDIHVCITVLSCKCGRIFGHCNNTVSLMILPLQKYDLNISTLIKLLYFYD